jgi:hypothetical protein
MTDVTTQTPEQRMEVALRLLLGDIVLVMAAGLRTPRSFCFATVEWKELDPAYAFLTLVIQGEQKQVMLEQMYLLYPIDKAKFLKTVNEALWGGNITANIHDWITD